MRLMVSGRYRVKIISTSKAGDSILAPLNLETEDGMVTPRQKVEVLSLKYNKKYRLNITPEDIAHWTSSSDIVITLLEVPDEDSISIVEFIAENAYRFNTILVTLVFFTTKLNPISWDFWATRYIPRVQGMVDSTILIPTVYSHGDVIQSSRAIFNDILQILRGLEFTILSDGLINLDAADLMAVTRHNRLGVVSMGYGIGSDPGRDAVRQAIQSLPLHLFSLGDVHTAMINVCGGPMMTLDTASGVTDELCHFISPMARIIWGATVREDMGNSIKVGLILGVQMKNLRIMDTIRSIKLGELNVSAGMEDQVHP